jgi:nitrogen-specific signal transduction histidine kinase
MARDGHGFGLHIVHEIVREHGGSIEVVSDDSRTIVSVEPPKGDPGMPATSDPQQRAAG